MIVEGDIDIKGGYIGIYNNGNVTVNSGKIESSNSSNYSGAIHNAKTSGIININGGELDGHTYSYGIRSKVTATINVNAGKIIGKYGVDSTGGTIEFNGGEIDVTGTGITSGSGTVNFNDGKINSTSTGIRINGGTLNFYKGVINSSSNGIYLSSGIVNFHSGEINSTSSGIYAYCSSSSIGTINIYDGKITGVSSNYAKINLYGGEIIGKSTGITIGRDSNLDMLDGYVAGEKGISREYGAGEVNIINGTVYGTTYGIYDNNGGHDKINIGDINAEVNKTNPSISGGEYGIYNYSTYYRVNFYNGIIKGINSTPYYAKIVPREGYMAYTYYDYDNEKKFCTVLTEMVDEITITCNPTEWTNKNVEVEVKYPVLDGAILQYSNDGETWEDVTTGNVYFVKVEENTKIYARMIDASGIIVKSVEQEITNIDKAFPTVQITPETTKYTVYDNGEAGTTTADITVNVNVSDNEGGSGIKTRQYGWTTSQEEQPTTWNTFNDGETIIKSDCTEGTYYLWFDVEDNAGNKSEIKMIRYIVEKQEAVARIGETYYYTIQSAFDAAGTTLSTVVIVRDTEETSTVGEEQEIILDLDGHTIGSATSEQAVITNNGTLTIIDTNQDKAGIIENLIGTGILNNGTLTLGDNSTFIDDNRPTISGKKVGIKNANVFNYYDGTIKGKTGIDGEVQATPTNYGPVGSYESGITIVNLRIVSEYVARIDWFYYTTLQSAIDACQLKPGNKTQTTITIIKDIVLENTAVTYLYQNIRLDLNGHILTSSKNSVLTNNCDLEITDLTEGKNGKITSSIAGTGQYGSSAYKIIQNNKYLNIVDITISTEKTYNYIIYNNTEAHIDINKGTLYANNVDYVYGIYDNSKGTININEGIINCTATTYVYGIYSSKGIININSGTITSTLTGSDTYIRAYGIECSGIINMNSGTVSAILTAGTTDCYATGITNSGTLNMYDGTVIGKVTSKSNQGYATGCSNSGTVNLEGGLIEANTVAVEEYRLRGMYNSGTVNVNGGTIRSSVTNNNAGDYGVYGIYNSSGKVNINDGNVECIDKGDHSNNKSNDEGTYAIINTGNGEINVNGGTVTCDAYRQYYWAYGIADYIRGSSSTTYTPKININGGTINAKASGNMAAVYSSGHVNMTGGTINVNSQNRAYGIEEGKEINIKGGVINVGLSTTSTCDPFGIYTSGKINMEGGTINSQTKSGIAFGICINGTAPANIGIKGDGVVNDSVPQINAIYVGIYSGTYTGHGAIAISSEPDSEVNFYDGKISSTHDILNGGLNEVEENYVISEFVENEYNVICLVPQSSDDDYIIENVATGKQYKTIVEAIGEVTEEEYELKVLQDFSLNTEFKIPEGVNVKIDLNGKIVTNKYYIISNYGNLQIDDSVSNGSIINYKTHMVNYEQASIELLNGTIQAKGVYGMAVYGIYNLEGIVNINGGTIDVRGVIETTNNYTYGIVYGIYTEGGTININGGILNCYSNQSARGIGYRDYTDIPASININGGKINVTGSETYGIQSYHSGNDVDIVNMNGGEIICDSTGLAYGIEFYYSGNLNIKGGMIKVNTTSSSKSARGIYIYNNAGAVLNLGTKGDGIVSNAEPSIIATNENGTNTYGIYSSGATINFYDGRIEGATRSITTSTTITAMEDNAELLYENAEKVLTLSTEEIPAAQIGDVTYNSLEEALEAAGTAETTIYLLRGSQYTIEDEPLTIASAQNITIDLQGYTINSSIENPIFINEGILKITDTSERASGKIVSTSERTLYNKEGATLEINNGTISNNFKDSDIIYNEGVLNIDGGMVLRLDENGYGYGYAINNTQTGVVNIISGTVTSTDYVIKNTGEVNISGGIVSILESNSSDYSLVIRNLESGVLNISGGIITASVKCCTGISNEDNASINMTGGSIEITSKKYGSYGIDNTSLGTVNIMGGTVTTTTTTTTGYNNGYGIYSIAGTINIGSKDGAINVEVPSISGKNIGIYSESTLNFYDGIIKGEELSVSGSFAEIEEQSEIAIGEEDTYKTISLVSVDSPIASIDDTQYYSLKDAIDSITGTETITIERSGIVSESIEISSDKDITIDLNGNTLSMYSKIKNEGILEITDSSTDALGVLKGYEETPINNNGTFRLSGGTISGNAYGIYTNEGSYTYITGGTIKENDYGIYVAGGRVYISYENANITTNTYGVFNNDGTVYLSNGNITGNTYGIYTNEGTTRITGGNITGNTYGIYNSSGSINLSEATINSNEYALYNNNGTTYITDITITGNTNEVVSAGSGTIQIGSKDGSVDITNPVIQGEEYGIMTSGAGTVKFYDGTVKGKNAPISGYYIDLEDNYSVKTDYIGGYYTDTLVPSGTVSTVAQIGSVEYTNLQSAINACTTSDEMTITLVNSINTEISFVIEEGQNIIIDLNGKTITSSTVENIIQNAGTLTIVDSSDTQTGKISNTYSTVINNTGTLNLGQNDGTVSISVPEIEGNTYGIVNTGNLYFYDGIIEAATALEGSVTGRPDGYLINKTTVDGIEQLVLIK